MFTRHRKFWRYLIGFLGLLFVVQVAVLIWVFYEPPFNSRDLTFDESLMPRPDFIRSLRYQPDYRDDVLAVVVDQEALWRNGDQARDLGEQIRQTAELEIAGQLLTAFESSQTLGLLNMGNGDDLVGTVGDPINFLFSLRDVPSGTYDVIFRVTDTVGTIHEYRWRITIS